MSLICIFLAKIEIGRMDKISATPEVNINFQLKMDWQTPSDGKNLHDSLGQAI
jgi:hypothetical protein